MNKKIINSFAFYRLPKALFSDQSYSQLSSLAKLLYAILLDRMSLSQANGEKWRDKNGNTFVYYTLDEVTEVLRCSKDTASRLMKELEQAALITRYRQGLGKPNMIFVSPYGTLQSCNKNPLISTSGVLISPTPEGGNSVGINTQTINKAINNYSHMSVEEAKMLTKTLIHYDILQQDVDVALLDSIVEVMQDVFVQTAPSIYISGESLMRSEVQSKLAGTNDMTVRYVCDRIRTEPRRITNPKAFILARLCDSHNIIDLFYQSQVDHDLTEDKHGK